MLCCPRPEKTGQSFIIREIRKKKKRERRVGEAPEGRREQRDDGVEALACQHQISRLGALLENSKQLARNRAFAHHRCR